MKLNEYLENQNLSALLDRYSLSNGDVPKSAMLRSIYDHMKNGRMTVPVLGMQGMGKSTLINSILGKNILPNDADETTCVPVEICYGEDEYAEVFFKNESSVRIVHSREELNSYVDNNENPANKKLVKKIVLYDKLPLLKSGMVIVDLPGVGSLTTENAETTKQYIQDLCTAIFVIPTTPTIRKQEAFFIKSVWSQFPTAIFVQNLWDESPRELKESVEYNDLMLKKIAVELNNKYDNDIIVVNAYNALIGAMKNDSKAMDEANLPKLLNVLERLADEWQVRMERNMYARLRCELISIRATIDKRLHDLDLTDEQVQEERMKELDQFNEQTKKLNKIFRGIDDYMDEAGEKISNLSKKKADDCAANIRKDIFRLIDSGVTDGKQLTSAFKDFQEEYVPEALDGMFVEFQRIKLDIDEKFDELKKVIIENNESVNTFSFENGDAFKFEKAFAPTGGIAGAIGGLAVGSVASGAIATALSIEAVSLTNPITLLPGLAAIAITAALGIVGGILGNTARKGVTKSRGEKTKEELAPYFDKISNGVFDAIINGFSKIRENVDSTIRQFKDDRKIFKQQLEEAVYSAADNTVGDRHVLMDDMRCIEAFIKEVSEDEGNI